MGEATEAANFAAKGALKKIKASKGRLQGNFYYAGSGKGVVDGAGLVVTLASRDRKGTKALTQGKSVRKELKGAKFARGTVTMNGGKLVFTMHNGSASASHLKKDFAKTLALLDGLKLLKSALIQKNGEKAEAIDEEDSGVSDEVITLTEAEEEELAELAAEQAGISNLNAQLAGFLSVESSVDELEDQLEDALQELQKLRDTIPLDEAAIRAARIELGNLLNAGPDLFSEPGEPISTELQQVIFLFKDVVEQDEAAPTVPTDSKGLYVALREARKTLKAALRTAYQEQQVPTAELMPIASQFSALEAPTREAVKVLKTDHSDPDAISAVQLWLEEHIKLSTHLERLVKRHARQRARWDKRKPMRDRLESFVGGDIKEGWSDFGLAKAMPLVRAPLNEALRLVAEGDFGAAIELLEEADRALDAANERKQQGLNAKADFEKNPKVKQARQQLQELKDIDETSFREKFVAELSPEAGMSDEDKQALARQGYAYLQAQLQANEALLARMLRAAADAAYEDRSDKIKVEIAEYTELELDDTLQRLDTLQKSLPGRPNADGTETLVDLEKHRQGIIEEHHKTILNPWKIATQNLKNNVNAASEQAAKLDGIGGDLIHEHQDLRLWQEHLATDPCSADKVTKHLALLMGASSISEVDAAMMAPHARERDAQIVNWTKEAERYAVAAIALSETLQEKRQQCLTALEEAKLTAEELLQGLRDLVKAYRGYKEIPERYCNKRDEMLKELEPYVESKNLQVLEHAKAQIIAIKAREFPTVPEAIAMFMSDMDRQMSWYNSNDDNRKAAAALDSADGGGKIDFQELETKLGALKSGPGKVTPKLVEALSAAVADVKGRLEESGRSEELRTAVNELIVEVDKATEQSGALGEELGRLKELQQRANTLLGKHLKNWIFDGNFTGDLKAEADAIQADAQEVSLVPLVGLLVARARELVEKTNQEWAGKDEAGLIAFIGEQQKLADEAKAQKEQEREEREKAWEAELQKYKIARGEAKAAGVPSDQISPLDSIRDNATKLRKAGVDKNHEVAMIQLETAISRADMLAKDPEAFQVTAKAELGKLPQKWADAIKSYKDGVTDLKSALSGLLPDVREEHKDTIRQAIARTDDVLNLFDPAAFDDAILAITFSAGTPDSIKAAREKGLSRVRAYRVEINSNPMLRAVLVNPFARVPITNVHKLLGDLDLNLQRCL